jgi:hypothetical protein
VPHRRRGLSLDRKAGGRNARLALLARGIDVGHHGGRRFRFFGHAEAEPRRPRDDHHRRSRRTFVLLSSTTSSVGSAQHQPPSITMCVPVM